MAYLADGAPDEAAVPAMPVSPYGVPAAPATAGSPRTVGEIGVKYYDVNEGYANTYGGYGRFSYAPSSNTDVWLGEVVYLDRFDDEGTYVALGNIHHFNEVYYSTVFVGTSAGGFFWPSVRVDASLSRKWLPRRNLVSTIGIGYYDAKDDHTDTSLLFEGIYYFDAPWIVQAGVRLNESDPGSVFSPSGYAAATYGRDLDRFVTLRYGTGNQGYQALTSPAFLVDFPFNEITLTWREWLQPDFGINLVGYGFESDPYDEIGFELGIFKEF
jgi:YaiO family outer membrane protein